MYHRTNRMLNCAALFGLYVTALNSSTTSVCAQPINIGGCCLPTNVGCEQTTPDICEAAGGEYQGGSCFQSACHIQFADCCRPDGFCSNATFQTCFNDYEGGWIPAGCDEPENCDDNNTCCEDLGACCHSGICEELSLDDCNKQPFGMYVPGYTCEDTWFCTDPEGACCFQHEGCLFLYQTNCKMMGGTFFDAEAGCGDIDIIDCSIRSGACCQDDGQCVDTIPTDCQGSDGQYHGDGSTCAFIGACPQPGACCDAYGDCWETIEENCYEDKEEFFQGEGTVCNDVECAIRSGACCEEVDPEDFLCYEEVTYYGCGGTYFGDETFCDDLDCQDEPVVGACCRTDGQCQILDTDRCVDSGGTYFGDFTICEESECMATEACCFADSSCIHESQNECVAQGGTPLGAGTNCTLDSCPELGRCCTMDGGCTNTDIESCFQILGGLSFGSGITCEIAACAPIGACCTDSGCITQSAGGCEFLEGQHYLGDDTECGSANCAGCPGSGDCLAAHEGVGCDEATCCQIVCDADAACCQTTWSSDCVDLAHTLCTIPVASGPVIRDETCHRYYLLESSSWRRANITARSFGGYLLAIGDAIENAWAYNELAHLGGTARNLWLGLNDTEVEGTFVWSNGEPTVYTNWVDGEPNHFTGEDYVRLRSFDGKWYDSQNGTGGTYGVMEVPPSAGSGDSTGDCKVTHQDLVDLHPCLDAGGPGTIVQADCLGPFDSDDDGDIDLRDGASFQRKLDAPSG